MANSQVKISALPSKNAIANSDLILVGNTTNTYSMAANTFRGHMANVATIKLPVYAVANVPAANAYTNNMIFVTNGANGNPCLAISNGTSWIVYSTANGAISAT